MIHALADPLSKVAIPAGSEGRVTWDEGGQDVIVEFPFEVPDHGYRMDTPRQAWIPRSFLRRAETGL